MTTYLPSKLVRKFGLLVASAFLAFSITAATAGAAPAPAYTAELNTLNSYLSTTYGATVSATTASESQLDEALIWSSTATAKSTSPAIPKGGKALSAATALLYAEAIQAVNTACYSGTASTILTDITNAVGTAGTKPKDLPVATVAQIANLFETGTNPSITYPNSVYTAGLSAGIFTTGTSKTNTHAVLVDDYINGLVAADVKGKNWTGVGTITNTVLENTNSYLSGSDYATVVASILKANSKGVSQILQTVVTGPTVYGVASDTFAGYLVGKLPTSAGLIVDTLAYSVPTLAGSIASNAIGVEVSKALTISNTLAAITTPECADGVAAAVVAGYTMANQTLAANKKVALNPAIATNLIKNVTLEATTSGSTAYEAKAAEIAQVFYTLATCNPKGLSGTALASAVDSLLGDVLAAAKLVKVTNANLDNVSAFYTSLAGDISATVSTLLGNTTLSKGQITALEGKLNASIAASGIPTADVKALETQVASAFAGNQVTGFTFSGGNSGNTNTAVTLTNL